MVDEYETRSGTQKWTIKFKVKKYKSRTFKRFTCQTKNVTCSKFNLSFFHQKQMQSKILQCKECVNKT
jgi:hypothetical protein